MLVATLMREVPPCEGLRLEREKSCVMHNDKDVSVSCGAVAAAGHESRRIVEQAALLLCKKEKQTIAAVWRCDSHAYEQPVADM